MNQPHTVHHLAYAVHADRRRAQRRPNAWTEASATLFRPPWAGFSWRKLWNGMKAFVVREGQPVPMASGEERKPQQTPLQA
ncbi:MAG: hypothetical protein R2932_42805 [Caldilineaceae bacterium]